MGMYAVTVVCGITQEAYRNLCYYFYEILHPTTKEAFNDR